jgi:hypothetical protein
MGTFAETAIIDYCLLFANQEKQTSLFHFPFVANRPKLPFSVSFVFCLRNSRNMETWRWTLGVGDMGLETWRWRHRNGEMEMETWRWRRGHGDMDMDMET